MHRPALLTIQCASCKKEMDVTATFFSETLKEITFVVDSCLCETEDNCKDCEDMMLQTKLIAALRKDLTQLKLQLKGAQQTQIHS